MPASGNLQDGKRAIPSCHASGKGFYQEPSSLLETIQFTLVFRGEQSLGKELYLQKKGDLEKCPSVSAFVQKRGKLRLEACRELFLCCNKECRDTKTYAGYRLLAVDGSDVNIARNPDSDTYIGNGDRGGFNQFHVNASYDVLNHTYLDAIVEPKTKYNE